MNDPDGLATIPEDDQVNAPAGPASPAPRAAAYAPWVAAGAVAAATLWAYLPTFRSLWNTWGSDPNYSHGYLVLPVAALVAWRRSGEARSGPPRGSAWGWAALVAALGARVYFFEAEKSWLEGVTMLPAIAGLVLAYGGWPMLRRHWPSVAFLLFLYPLPQKFNDTLAMQLQGIATMATCRVLRGMGQWVLEEGNVIIVGGEKLEVATACSGLAMLMSLSSTVVTALLLLPLSNFKRAALLVSVVPIALVSNVIRITATALCYQRFGHEVGEKYAHDLAGYLMMPLALTLVFLELGLLNWLVEEQDEAAAEITTARLDFVGGVPTYGGMAPGGRGSRP